MYKKLRIRQCRPLGTLVPVKYLSSIKGKENEPDGGVVPIEAASVLTSFQSISQQELLTEVYKDSRDPFKEKHLIDFLEHCSWPTSPSMDKPINLVYGHEKYLLAGTALQSTNHRTYR
ncbi:unnamed protein product [Schistocephalus solidus]|uniref:DUF4806 domain-containing protein n=1 Tax=Schistocephalus solidus TaxID=70667 RepID=A0A183S8D0_SCHSO|nr:unnamed protein product [Schistocephalus solidus]